MRPRKRRGDSRYNFWQPATDMMSGLVFVLILVIALLGLYILSDYTGYLEDYFQLPQRRRMGGRQLGQLGRRLELG